MNVPDHIDFTRKCGCFALQPADQRIGAAVVNGPQAQYLAYLRDGRFLIQRSRSTGRYTFYPRIAIPGTGETDLEWVEASGSGTVYAITVNRSRDGAYNIALIDLDEGPRMMSRVEGVETVPIGTRVRARIVRSDDEPAIVFDVAGPETAKGTA